MSKLRKHDYTLDGSEWDLSSLSLSDTPIEELKRNPKARKIDLSNNMLTTLPPTFTSLTHLVSLDLSKNRLTELPESFGNLNKLIRLDLYKNQLKTLPLTFGQLPKLKWLDLKGNPLEPTLAKYAGDCANQRQCELCAINCIKFMKSEKSRIESEMSIKEEKMRQQKEYQKNIEEKNKKDKEKKRAKNARRSARKAQQLADNNQDINNESEDSDSIDRTFDQRNQKSRNSFGSYILWVLRFLVTLLFILFILFINISIGLHLLSGAKLETMSDIKTALSNSFKNIQNYEQFSNEVKTLFQTVINGLNNWRKTFNISLFDNKQNVSNN